MVVGATGTKVYKWTTTRRVDLGAGRVSHSFLVIPECPTPLLGRDLLTKVNAEIQFSLDRPQVKWHPSRPVWTLTLNLADEYRMHEGCNKMDIPKWWLSRFPEAWAETGGGGRNGFPCTPLGDHDQVRRHPYQCTSVPHEQGGKGGHPATHK